MLIPRYFMCFLLLTETLLLHFLSCDFWQELATFFYKGQYNKYFRLCDMVSVITTQFCFVVQKQSQTIHKHVGMAVFQYSFTYKHWNLNSTLFSHIILLLIFFLPIRKCKNSSYFTNLTKTQAVSWTGPSVVIYQPLV